LLVGYATTSASTAARGNKVGVILPAVLVPVIATLAVAVAVAVWVYCRRRVPYLTPTTQPGSHHNNGLELDSRPPPTAPPHADDLPPPYTAAP